MITNHIIMINKVHHTAFIYEVYNIVKVIYYLPHEQTCIKFMQMMHVMCFSQLVLIGHLYTFTLWCIRQIYTTMISFIPFFSFDSGPVDMKSFVSWLPHCKAFTCTVNNPKLHLWDRTHTGACTPDSKTHTHRVNVASNTCDLSSFISFLAS